MDFIKATSEYTRKSSAILKKNWKILMLLILFTLGMLLGTYLVKQDNKFVLELLPNLFKNYINSKECGSIAVNFISSLSVNFFFLIFSFILGLCVIGIPFIAMIPFLKGVGIGMLCGYMYLKYTFGGLGYCVLIIYPGLIISLLALLMSCNLSISSSYNLLLVSTGNNEKTSKKDADFKIYCLRNLIVLIITVFSSVIDSIVIKMFSNLFSF